MINPRHYPNIHNINLLMRSAFEVREKHGDRWYPARPLGPSSISNRLRAAWLVLIGRADALTWHPMDPPPRHLFDAGLTSIGGIHVSELSDAALSGINPQSAWPFNTSHAKSQQRQ